jgi:hypothetical protein
LAIYKKFNQNSLISSKLFDPYKSQENPPENCGYALRIFKLNTSDLLLEIKHNKSKHIENKINLSSIKGILLGNTAKGIIKSHNQNNLKHSQEMIKKNYAIENIPFSLLVDDGMLDLVSPSYNSFLAFQKGIEEICLRKKNYSSIFKYLEK